MHTITVNNYDELDDLCDFLAEISKDKFDVAMYLLNNLGAVKAQKRISWNGFTADEIPKSLIDHEVLRADLTWHKVIHDFKDHRNNGKRFLVFESEPTIVYEYDADLLGHYKIYDIQRRPFIESKTPAKQVDDWVVAPLPETKKRGK